MSNNIVVNAKQLKKLSYDLLVALGIPDEDAEYGARVLNEADIRGVDTHGVARLQSYAMMIKAEKINTKAKLTPIVENDSLLYLDAENGLGIVMAARAVEICIEKAKKSGVCIASIKNSGHWGISGYYSQEAARKGMIGISISNSGAAMVPFGGRNRVLGNSPWSIAFPAGKKYNYPIIFDMACSTVAGGKIEMALRKNEEIPFGWLVDEMGIDTHDPTKFFKGCGLLPFGGPKGYVLATLLEILASVLSGASYGNYIGTRVSGIKPSDPPKMPEDVGHLLIVIDVNHIRPIEEVQDYLDKYLDDLKNSEPSLGGKGIILPGEIEARNCENRSLNNFELNEKVAEDLLKIAKEVGYVTEEATVKELFKKCLV